MIAPSSVCRVTRTEKRHLSSDPFWGRSVILPHHDKYTNPNAPGVSMETQHHGYVYSSEDLFNLTGRKKYSKQLERLTSIGLTPVLHDNGFPAVTPLAVAIAMNRELFASILLGTNVNKLDELLERAAELPNTNGYPNQVTKRPESKIFERSA